MPFDLSYSAHGYCVVPQIHIFLYITMAFPLFHLTLRLAIEPRFGYSKKHTERMCQLYTKGVTGFDGDQEVNGACRALGVSLNLREPYNCQRRIGSRSVITTATSPHSLSAGMDETPLQQAGPMLVLSNSG